MTSSSEVSPPLLITLGRSLLVVLNAPMAAFFSLLDDVHWPHSVSLSLALAWSVVLGYLISFVWHVGQRRIVKRLRCG